MHIKTTTLDKKSDGNTVVIKRQVEETLTKNDVLQRKNQLQFQAEDLKRQMQGLKQRFEDLNLSIVECDELLATFTDTIPEM